MNALLLATEPTMPTETPSGASSLEALILVVITAVVILIIASATYYTLREQKIRAITYMRVSILLATVAIGAILALAEAEDAARTAAFTHLGTVAGYVAGSSPLPAANR